jgi:hypothetical protein
VSLQANVQAKRKRGRQTVYTDEIGEEILDRLAEGESLESICDDPYMPNATTVLKWAHDTEGKRSGAPAFSQDYARARTLGYWRMADEIISIGDEAMTLPDGSVDNAAVQRARIRCENRKWMLSKMLPKQFGDKVTAEITGDPDAPLVTRIELVGVPAKRLEAPTIEADDGYDSGSPPSAKAKP